MTTMNIGNTTSPVDVNINGTLEVKSGTIGGFDIDNSSIVGKDSTGFALITLDKRTGMLQSAVQGTNGTLSTMKFEGAKLFARRDTDALTEEFRADQQGVFMQVYDKGRGEIVRSTTADSEGITVINPEMGGSLAYKMNGKDIATVDDLNNINVGGRNYLLESYGRPTGSNSGITRTYLGNCTYQLQGTATGANDPVFYSLAGNNCFIGEGTYTLSIIGDVSKLNKIYISLCSTNDTSTSIKWFYNNTDEDLNKITFKVASNELIRYIGYNFSSGAVLNNTYQFKLEKGKIATDWTPAPEDIAPAIHTHTKSEITDFPTSMTPTAHTHTKSQITDFPSTMPPSTHTHSSIESSTMKASVGANSLYPNVTVDADGQTSMSLGATSNRWGAGYIRAIYGGPQAGDLGTSSNPYATGYFTNLKKGGKDVLVGSDIKDKFSIERYTIFSSKEVAATTTIDEATYTISKSGYYALAICGYRIAGTNPMYCNLFVLDMYDRGSEPKIRYRLRNTSSGKATLTLTVDVLWIKTN